MLEPVAAQRSGGTFVVPGLFQDARGVVVSSEAAIVVHSHDQLLALVRIVSDEASLGELLSSLHAEALRSPIGGQGFMLRLRVSDSRILDRLARAAAFCGGQLSVGAGRHFVRYRDAQSPYGYDAPSIVHSSDADYLVYAPQTTLTYVRSAELSLVQLVRTPRLLPRLGGFTAALRTHDPREPLWLLAPALLLPRLLRYLWLRRVEAAVMLPETSPGTPTEHLTLLRVPGDVARSPGALQGLPGLRWLAAVCDHIAVELGHAHPLNLLSLAALFPDSERHLFLADPAGPLSLPAGPFVPARHLVRVEDSAAPLGPQPAAQTFTAVQNPRMPDPTAQGSGLADRLQPVRVPLGLVQTATSAHAPAGARVPWSQLSRLTRLTYLLPPTALANLRAAALRDGVLIIGDVSHLPLGDLYYEAGSQLLIPLGLALVPRVSPSVLRAQLDAATDSWLLFQPALSAQPAPHESVGRSAFDRRDSGERIPLSVHELPASALHPLAQILLQRMQTQPLELASLTDGGTAATDAPQAVYGSLGWLWPLWGGPRLAAASARLPAASSSIPIDGADDRDDSHDSDEDRSP